jgi:dTDP-4-amino-4,6-dideoxygalactose transaminase
MIPVTKPFLPNKTDLFQLINEIFERNWLTNNGPVLKKFESKLNAYLDTENGQFVSNGTIALQLAIKALNLKGNIITTPFSYVATVSSLVWEGCKPKFIDIDPHTFNIDVRKIEQEINSETSAILVTHVFGNPCEIMEIQKIADKYSLKVIYDGAHCFGTTYNGRSIFNYGDVSTLSLHATKLLNSVEGGMVFCKDNETSRLVNLSKNFGHNGPEIFDVVGVNGKNSEIHAAFGLLNLRHADEILEKRKYQYFAYLNSLKGVEFQHLNAQGESNYSYFPILLDSEETTISLIKYLNDNAIFPRRYFYPSLDTLPYVSGHCPVARDISSRILCLPLFHDLVDHEQEKIISIINNFINF